MARTPFVAGNWKMNTTRASAIELAKAVAKGAANASIDIGVAPPYVYLDVVAQALAGSRVMLGAQNVFYEKVGAFTGEVSVDMLKDLGVKFCLAGHSERRHIIKESSDLVSRKATEIFVGGLTLIHCVGEKMEERDANQTLAVVQRQLDELKVNLITDPHRLVVAYEPVWAIGTGRSATAAQAQEVHAFIRSSLAKRWNADFADAVRVLYGGSATAENVGGFAEQEDIDGGLIGGASLKPDSFLLIVNTMMKLE